MPITHFHLFCSTARTKLQEAFTSYAEVWVSRQVFREFAAVVSREMQATGNFDFDKLEQTILRFEQDLLVAEDSQFVTHRWLQLLRETNSTGKQIHDTNITATMLVYKINALLTHNVSDFHRFSHLITVVPLI